MVSELQGFKITVTHDNGYTEVFHHLFSRFESVCTAMDKYVSTITFLEKHGKVETQQIWS